MSRFEHVYGNVRIVVVTGDITKEKVEAIVNPANSFMVMGGGVAGAIKRAGGREIEEEAVKGAPVKIGGALATKAGRLDADYVIHAPTMERPAMQIGVRHIKSATKGALECAEKQGVKSIAFPGMGTGVGGVRFNEAAVAMLEEVKKHIDLGTSLGEIVLVGFTTGSAQTFERVVSETLKKHSV
jgi:O-acetyl-ADP-ribose deacetylase (regulator of RNase III)